MMLLPNLRRISFMSCTRSEHNIYAWRSIYIRTLSACRRDAYRKRLRYLTAVIGRNPVGPRVNAVRTSAGVYVAAQGVVTGLKHWLVVPGQWNDDIAASLHRYDRSPVQRRCKRIEVPAKNRDSLAMLSITWMRVSPAMAIPRWSVKHLLGE